MKLGLRLLFGFFLITGLAAFFVLRVFEAEIKPSDKSGRVVFESGFREVSGAEGEDYSRWNDVSRTLAGRYNARATRELQHGDSTSSMYVAAPVKQGDRIIGVLTVAKPVRKLESFVERAQREILERRVADGLVAGGGHCRHRLDGGLGAAAAQLCAAHAAR
jgi:hypothetical protein